MSSKFYELYGKIIASDGVTPIPMALFRHQAELGLTSDELAFVCYMLTYRWTPGSLPFPSLRGMAKATGVPLRNLHRRKDSLIEKKYLNVITRKDDTSGQLTNGYDFTPLFQKLEYIIGSHNKGNGPKPANGLVFDDPLPPGDKMAQGDVKSAPAGAAGGIAPVPPVAHEIDNTSKSVVVTPVFTMNFQEKAEVAPPAGNSPEWTVSGIQNQVAAVAGATIAPSVAERIMRRYRFEDLTRALNEMQRQMTNGTLRFEKGVGSWLQAALKERWDQDSIPAVRGKQAPPKAALNPHDYLDQDQADKLEALRAAEAKRALEKELAEREAREKHRQIVKTLWAN